MLYLGLLAADITLSLLSRGPASQQSRNLAVNFREVVHSVLTRNTDVAKALAVRDMYAEGCRAAVLYRGGSASQSEITIGPTSPSAHGPIFRPRCESAEMPMKSGFPHRGKPLRSAQ